ncbi:sodium:solute symporter family transporter [Sporosarcina sp. A2]|uniref:sodium:solute symporter family transporter n=1 Tax=Sporosarcina sp. A2 TaxID=3393449 RepID=UPI003D7A81FD
MKQYSYYITGAITLGFSTAIISLLARWITANTILSSPEALVKYGLVGSISYSFMGAFALFLFGLISVRIRTSFPDLLTIGDLFQTRLRKDGYYLMSSIVLFLGLDSLFMQAVGASVLFELLLGIPIWLSLFLFFIYTFLVAGFGGMKWIHRLEGPALLFTFSAIIFIPMFFFISEGASNIYNGIRLLHPYLLYINNKEAAYLAATAMLIGFGQMISDRATWQRLYIIDIKKVRMSFYLTALVWSTIPLALGGMLMIVIYDQSFVETYSLLFELVKKIEPILLSSIFFLFCFSAISSTANAELHATTIHFVRHIFSKLKPNMSDVQLYKASYLFSGILLFVLLLISLFFNYDALEFLFFFGSLYASIIPVMLFITLSKRRLSRLLPYAVPIGAASVYLFPVSTGPLLSIWVSFLISLIFSFVSMLFAERELY